MISLDDIEALIVAEHYWKVPGDAVTVCALTMKNGYTVVGHSGVANPEEFDEEIGKEVARHRAIQQIWPLLGYEAATRLKEGR